MGTATYTPQPHDFAGVYDEFGSQLTHAHVQQHMQHLLGDQLSQLAEHHYHAAKAAQVVAQIADHPIHALAKKAADDLASAAHGRLSGRWTLDRYDAPIELYAYKILHNIGYGQQIAESEYANLDFHALPASVRIAADAAMKRGNRRQRTEWDEEFDNLFLTVGVTAMWQQSIGTSISANSGGSNAQIYAYYNNAQARIGVGDSSTAASAGQTDLQAVTNKYYVGMDATYPTQSTNQIVLRSTFTSLVALYAWQEFIVDNCNASNSTSTTRSGGSTLDRVVSNQGTKASGQVWQPSMTLSLS